MAELQVLQNPTASTMSLGEVARHRANLEEVERHENRPPFMLTMTELKLIGIAGVGFFLDAYDLFIINPVTTMLQYRLYGGGHLPANLEGFVKAGANIGSVIGQFLFGYLADSLGRKTVYGKELMLIIVATILSMSTPTGSLSPKSCLIYLGMFRILLGVGVGGDYPMSASVASERANLRKRGTMLAYVFSSQGWGSLVGSLLTMIVLLCYKNVMNTKDETSKVDGVWRIVIGFSLIPAFGTLYQRLTLPESTRYLLAQKIRHQDLANEAADSIELLKKEQKPKHEHIKMDNLTPSGRSIDNAENPTTTEDENNTPGSTSSSQNGASVEKNEAVNEATAPIEVIVKKAAHIREAITYFSEWRHAKLLIGTCMCWFLLDIAFYGINLNQNIVLQQIGYDGSTGTPWERLFKISTGGIIITALGFVPGYYATVLTIEILGRKWIQIQGFLAAALFLGILAGKFHSLSKAAFIVCFAFLQFFFNFGANTTTYCYPAEVFPTRFRASAHGTSAACGKAGAIITALVFNTLSQKIGTPAVLWIFVGCCIAGAFFTLLLPEVMGRDPDVILAEEIRVRREERRAARSH